MSLVCPLFSIRSSLYIVNNNDDVFHTEAGNVLQGSIHLIDEDFGPKKNPKRGILPKVATRVMKSWLFQHIVVSNLRPLLSDLQIETFLFT